MTKGKYNAAANRYKRATLYDPGSPAGFLKLGEAEEKLHNFDLARDAYGKYLDLAKNAKDAEAIKKRMAKWPPPPK
jgi:predicted TPR repeat methyltransferase